jgi:hypothetical protein
VERSTDNRKVEGSTPFRPINHVGSYTFDIYCKVVILEEMLL